MCPWCLPHISARLNACSNPPNLTRPPKNRVSKLLEQASSTLGYLKMVTPKRRIGTAADTSSGDSEEGEATGGRTYLVYKDGEGRVSEEAMRREKAAYSNWDGSNMDPDNVRRHQHQLSRMGFRDNTHAKGGIF